jgi:hypothetical protein
MTVGAPAGGVLRWPTFRRRPVLRRLRFPLAVFGVVALAVFAVGQLTLHFVAVEAVPHSWPDHRWLDVFARWDTGWYWHIAHNGYYYDGPGQQSAVAFFPAYPLAMRAAAQVIPGDLIVAGVVLTLAAGSAVAVLFHEWCRAAFGEAAARVATLLLFLYPFAYYFLGAVYSDAFFLAAALAAFLLLERDHPLWAALAGALATAARPIGIALVVGLFLRSLELHGVLGGARPRLRADPPGSDADHRTPFLPSGLALRRLRWSDAAVLLSASGFLAFCGLLWWRFGEPLAFLKVEGAEGWNRKLDLGTVTMHEYFALVRSYGLNAVTFSLTLQGLFSIATVAALPAIVRRLGWGYAAYTILGVAVPLLSSPEFFGMGRYVLVGFPAFAVLGASLARARVWARVGVLAVNGGLLLFLASLFARWYLLA